MCHIRDFCSYYRSLCSNIKDDHTDVRCVEIEKFNGLNFKGTVTYKEAKTVFTDLLGMDPGKLYAIKFGFTRCPTIKYKLTLALDACSMIKNNL